MTILTLEVAATEICWEIPLGETFTIVVPVLDVANQLVDVTGWTPLAQVRRSRNDPLLYEWSTAHSNITCSGTNVLVSVIEADTRLWTFTTARTSLVVTDLTGKPHVIADGVIQVDATVSFAS